MTLLPEPFECSAQRTRAYSCLGLKETLGFDVHSIVHRVFFLLLLLAVTDKMCSILVGESMSHLFFPLSVDSTSASALRLVSLSTVLLVIETNKRRTYVL
jgi:hypothetical protein